MARPFYFSEVSQMADQFLQQNGYYNSFEYVFPQWSMEMDSWTMIGQYVSQDMGLPTEVQVPLQRHVVEYRENYTDFPMSAIALVEQHKDWMQGNYTFMEADVAVFMVELDSALRMGSIILSQRPECGVQDSQMFVQEVVSSVQNSLQMTLSYMMSSNSYLYNIVNQQILQSFQSLFSMAVMDMYCPMRALQQLELNFFETNRALIRKQLNNLSTALNWYINSGLLVAMTNQREWLLNTVQNVDTRPCQGQM